MPYPTPDELAQGNAALEALDPDQLQLIYDGAISAIETYAGQAFGEVYDGAHEVESVRGDALYLPQRIIELRSLIPLNGDPVELAVLAVTHDGGRLAWKRGVTGVGYYEQALYEISGYDYPTCFPDSWVTIDGRWGWEQPPMAVNLALRMDMAAAVSVDDSALTATVSYMRRMGIEHISQGNLDLTLAPVPSISPAVASLLDPYVFRGTPAGRLV